MAQAAAAAAGPGRGVAGGGGGGGTAGGPPQALLFDGSIDWEGYGDHVAEVKFSEPVQVTAISVMPGRYANGGGGGQPQQQALVAWALDLALPSASRFVPLIVQLTAPTQEAPVTEAVATDHLLLHGKARSITVRVHGYVLSQAAAQVKAAVEQEFGGPLLPAAPALPLPSAVEDAAAPQLRLSPVPLLPLASLPQPFVNVLRGALDYWRMVRLSHSRIEATPPDGCLERLVAVAEAVLAALRGNPGALQAELAAPPSAQGSAAVWASIQGEALDMAAGWTSMLASDRTHAPPSVETGVAGLAAAILLAACPATAAALLAAVDERGVQVGLEAVRHVLTVLDPPALISRFALGLLELLLGSCPVVSCAALLGPLTPSALAAARRAPKEEKRAAQPPGNGSRGGSGGGGGGGGGDSDRSAPPGEASRNSAGSSKERLTAPARHGERRGPELGRDGARRHEREPLPVRKRIRTDGGGSSEDRRRDPSHRERPDGGGRKQQQQQQRSSDRDASARNARRQQPQQGGGSTGRARQDAKAEAKEEQQDDREPDSDGELLQQLQDEVAAWARGDEPQDDKAGLQLGDARGPAAFEGKPRRPAELANREHGRQRVPTLDDTVRGRGGGGGGDRRQGHQSSGTGPGSSGRALERTSGQHGSGGGGGDAGERRWRDGDRSGRGSGGGDLDRPARDDGGPGGQTQGASSGRDAERDSRGRREDARPEPGHKRPEAGRGGGAQDTPRRTSREPSQTAQGGDAAGRRSSASDDGRQPEDKLAAVQQAKLLAQRRAEAAELYGGLLRLAAQLQRGDAAASCLVVMRRVKACECVHALRSIAGPWLTGGAEDDLPPPEDLARRLREAAAAVSELSVVVLRPPAAARQHSGAGTSSGGGGSGAAVAEPAEADVAVLHLMLGFRVLQLLSVLVSVIEVHCARLAQQQQQQQQEQWREQPVPADGPLNALLQERAGLMGSLQVLVSTLACSSAGWAYLRTASAELVVLARAVSPTAQVSLDGGDLLGGARAPAVQGVGPRLLPQLSRQLSGASKAAGSAPPPGPAADSAPSPGPAAEAELAADMQRLALLADAVRELEQVGGPRLGAAVQALLQCCLASEVGRQATVAALASSTPALRGLMALARVRSKVLEAAAGADDGSRDTAGGGRGRVGGSCGGSGGGGGRGGARAVAGSVGRGQGAGVPTAAGRRCAASAQELLLAADGKEAGGAGQLGVGGAGRLPAESLHAPELLLAVLSEPHGHALAAWLPLAESLHPLLEEELRVQRSFGEAAAAAAFPAGPQQPAGGAGLPLACEPGAAAAAAGRQQRTLLQLQGRVRAARALLLAWRDGDGSGAGSGVALLDVLASALPTLRPVAAGGGAVAGAAGDAAGDGGRAARDASAAATPGAASVAGAPPPGGADVDPQAAVALVSSSPADLAAAACSLDLLAMLLRGAPGSVRRLAAAAADRPAQRAALQRPLNPAAALNPNGALGPGGAAGVGRQDALSPARLAAGLLDGGVLELLERALRTGCVGLEASASDLLWAVRGGSAQDGLDRLRGRQAAAGLLLAAASATAELLLLLAEAGAQGLSAQGLLDAIVCAHAAVATSHEGLAAAIASPSMLRHMAAVADVTASRERRAAAMAAAAADAARTSPGRAHTMLLAARQQLAACLCAWQRWGWWPNCVGAVLGCWSQPTPALEDMANEEAEARAKPGGKDRNLPPPPVRRLGPRQLLAAAVALGDLCPEEWPPWGASQAMARSADAAAAAAAAAAGPDGGQQAQPQATFGRPPLMALRLAVASSLEAQMRLAAFTNLVTVGASADSRLMRAAIMRLCLRAGGLGGGMPPLLVPMLVGSLRELLKKVLKAQVDLDLRMQQLAAEGHSAAAQQRATAATRATMPQLADGRPLVELLLLLAEAPGFKAAFVEAAQPSSVGTFSGYLARCAAGSRDQQECHMVVSQLLRLLGTLLDPDVTLRPLAPRAQRELEDTPQLADCRTIVRDLLSCAHLLSPQNVEAAVALLIGSPQAGGGQPAGGLLQLPRGPGALRLGVLRWYMEACLDNATRQALVAGGNATLPSTQAVAIDWACGQLQGLASAPGADAVHAAACVRVAEALRRMGPGDVGSPDQGSQVEPCMFRIANAVTEAVGAAPPSAGVDGEDLRLQVLGPPAAALACSLGASALLRTSLDDAAAAPPRKVRPFADLLPAPVPSSVSDLMPQLPLVAPRRPYTQSPPVAVLRKQLLGSQQQQQQQPPQEPEQEQQEQQEQQDDAAEGGAVIPVVKAPRRFAGFKRSADESGSRKMSLHVDEYEASRGRARQPHLSTSEPPPARGLLLPPPLPPQLPPPPPAAAGYGPPPWLQYHGPGPSPHEARWPGGSSGASPGADAVPAQGGQPQLPSAPSDPRLQRQRRHRADGQRLPEREREGATRQQPHCAHDEPRPREHGAVRPADGRPADGCSAAAGRSGSPAAGSDSDPLSAPEGSPSYQRGWDGSQPGSEAGADGGEFGGDGEYKVSEVF